MDNPIISFSSTPEFLKCILWQIGSIMKRSSTAVTTKNFRWLQFSVWTLGTLWPYGKSIIVTTVPRWCLAISKYNQAIVFLLFLQGRIYLVNHRDLSIHIEWACQLHGAITTQHGLLSWMDMYKRKLWLDQVQPNLAYADVKLNIACMHPLHTLSLREYCDLYAVNRQNQ